MNINTLTACRRAGVKTLSQMQTLLILRTSTCSQGYIADRCGNSAAGQTVIKYALLKTGLISQQKTGTEVFLALTKKGRELMQEIGGFTLDEVAGAQR